MSHRMRWTIVLTASLMIVALLAQAAGAESVVLFEDTFDGDWLADHWILSGSVDPFNRVEVFDGVLEFEGGVGNEGFGVWARPEIDVSQGPITIELDLTRNASNDWSEITVWLVHEWLPHGGAWTQGTFLRVQFLSQGLMQVQKEFGNGIGEVLASAPAPPLGQKTHVAFRISTTGYEVSYDGEVVVRGNYNLPFDTGYLYIADWNSLAGDIDLIDNVKVTQER